MSCTIAGVNVASIYVTLDARPEQFAAFTDLFKELAKAGSPALICGDMNTSRDKCDSWSFVESMKKRGYGCDPTAMGWFQDVFVCGWFDSIELDWPGRPLYTWWAGSALFDRGDGTRLDYILASESAQAKVVLGSSGVMTKNRFGGHAQICLTLNQENARCDGHIGSRRTVRQPNVDPMD